MILSIIQQKGETGNNTIAVNLSRTLIKKGCRTLLIDLNPEAILTSMLGLNKTHLGFMDVIKSNSKAEDVILTVDGIIDVIPSDTTPDFMQSTSNWEDETEPLFKTALSSLKDMYEYIIIDCPSDLSFATLNAVDASDVVMVLFSTALTGVIHESMNANRYSLDILDICAKLKGTEPIKISGDDQIIDRIDNCLSKNKKLLVLDPSVSFNYADRPVFRKCITEFQYLESSKEYFQEYLLYLN